jgi:predicted ATP-grasp superfamily ATP-dependent carboligase
MRGITKEFLSFLLVLIMAFLLLTHSSGFSADVKAGLGGVNTLTRTLQGR